jgi:hypothetical protein
VPCRTQAQNVRFLQRRMELVGVFNADRTDRCPESGSVPEWNGTDSESKPELGYGPKLDTECRVFLASLAADVQGQQHLVDWIPRATQDNAQRHFGAIAPSWGIQPEPGRTYLNATGPPADSGIERRDNVSGVRGAADHERMDTEAHGHGARRRAADNDLRVLLCVTIKPE